MRRDWGLLMLAGCLLVGCEGRPWSPEGGTAAMEPGGETPRLSVAVKAFREAAGRVVACYEATGELVATLGDDEVCAADPSGDEVTRADVHQFLFEENHEETTGLVAFRPHGQLQCSFMMRMQRTFDPAAKDAAPRTALQSTHLRCPDVELYTPSEAAAIVARAVGAGAIECLQRGVVPDARGACGDDQTVFESGRPEPSMRVEVIDFQTTLRPEAAHITYGGFIHPVRHLAAEVSFAREGQTCSFVLGLDDAETEHPRVTIAHREGCE